MKEQWEGFVTGNWTKNINVRNFIQQNYTPYTGDESFLEGPTKDTLDLWNEILDLFKKERENNGVLDMETSIISTITSYKAGYIDKEKEKLLFKEHSLSPNSLDENS